MAAGKVWGPMRAKRVTKASPPFLLNKVDRFGRQIAPVVFSVAKEIGPRSVSYAEKLLADSALALTFFEQAAATVSEVLEAKRSAGAPAVKNLAAYLFRTFIRLVGAARRKDALLQESLRQNAGPETLWDEVARIETAVLVDEVMASCAKVAREIAFRRLEGFSWKEIGKEFGISANAAELRFNKSLEQARKTLGTRARKGGGESHPASFENQSKETPTESRQRQTLSGSGQKTFRRGLPEPKPPRMSLGQSTEGFSPPSRTCR
jgi:DNA-directed RNA polymerase specialized sigma24 family protein